MCVRAQTEMRSRLNMKAQKAANFGGERSPAFYGELLSFPERRLITLTKED